MSIRRISGTGCVAAIAMIMATPAARAQSATVSKTSRITTTGRGPLGATASGFAVSAEGDIVTNRHVVNRCQSITVRVDSITTVPAKIVALHKRDDLAVIRAATVLSSVASFRVGPGIRPGDDVVAVGFPLAGLLADEASVTTGSVSAMAGIHNNQSVMQMSAPVQQGSSGGPLFDASGNVVGIVVTKLNAQIVVEETGDLPQNVNFAVKGNIARAFLDELGISPRTATSTTHLSNADVGDIGRQVTVLVECSR